MAGSERYIPALGFKTLTPLFDPAVRLLMREAQFKRQLIAQARIKPHMRVLDVGCGTGTLAVMIKQAQPDAEVVGLDGDPQVLARARAKAARAGIRARFDDGVATRLPYDDGSFDRVVSSLVFHHLAARAKRQALGEIHRVLTPRGELHVADLGKPHNLFAFAVSRIIRRLEHASENIDGRLPELFQLAGFESLAEPTRLTTVVGTLALYRLRKSGGLI